MYGDLIATWSDDILARAFSAGAEKTLTLAQLGYAHEATTHLDVMRAIVVEIANRAEMQKVKS